MRTLTALFISLAMLLSPTLGQTSVQVVEKQLTSSLFNQYQAAASGPLTVYTDTSNGSADVLGIDGDGNAFAVTAAVGNQDNPDIDGNLIVYVDDSAGNYDIVLYDLVTHTSWPVVSSLGEDFDPVISGSNVLFVSTRGLMDDIYWLDLLAGEVAPLTNSTAKSSSPALDGFLAAWTKLEEGRYRVYATHLGTAPFLVSAGGQHEWSPAVSGNLVAFLSDNNVVVYDLATQQLTRITNDTLAREKLLISGNNIVWTDARNGNLDIFLHNLTDGMTYQLTSNPRDQILTDISGNRVVYHDMRANNLDVWSLTFTVNYAPVANAGLDQSVHVGNLVTLDGSKSSDPEGDQIAYAWSLITNPPGSSVTLQGSTTGNPSFQTDMPGIYRATLVVTDSDGNVSPPATVTINTSNTSPEAVAGPDNAVVSIGSRVTLDGSRSFDRDGDEISYLWEFVTKPAFSMAVLDNASIPKPSFIADASGTYEIRLVVTDKWGGRATDLVAFSAVPQPPRADIALTKAAPATLILGSPLAYTLTLSDNGPDAASNVTLNDTLPAGTTYVSILPSQGRCTVSGSAISCALGGLASGASAMVALTVQPTAEGTVTNTATATATEADPNPANNSAGATTVVTLGQPRISGTIAAKGIQGQTATQRVIYLDVRLTNSGTGHARNLKITGLPAKPLAGTGMVSYNTILSPPLPITVGNLDVGEAKTIRLYFNVPKTVTRFSVTENGTLQNVVGTGFSYSALQSVMP